MSKIVLTVKSRHVEAVYSISQRTWVFTVWDIAPEGTKTQESYIVRLGLDRDNLDEAFRIAKLQVESTQ